MTDAKNSSGMLMFSRRGFDVAFPVRYPEAKCPTAHIVVSSQGFVNVQYNYNSFLD
jgi:hypothetical protein